MSSADSGPDLVALADRLYAAPPGEFTAARDAAAKSAGDRAFAKRVKALRKPSTAAWAVNLLVRRESERIDEVLDLAQSLRDAAAAMDGDELRALTRQRRQLTTALAGTARALAREYEVRLSGAVTDQVEGVLTAAMLDQVAAQAVRTGLLVVSFGSTGVSELDLDQVLAVPEALGTRAHRLDAPEESARPALHVVPEDDALRLERAELAAAEAESALAARESELAAVRATVEDWAARQLQIQDELDGLRRRIADLEAEADRVDAEVEDAEAACEDAEIAAREARRGHDAAQRALVRARDGG